MAQRRMFSPEIVCSEEFLDMPPSAQALYFHLAMRADDDGFVQPNLVMRNIGANKDDLKVLIAKRFALSFESGVVVVKHWLIHNMIRIDRYKPTRFKDEKNSLFIKENKAYTDNPENGLPLLATKWQPSGNHPAPQVRLGKVSTSSEIGISQIVEVKEGNSEREPQKKAKYPNSRSVFQLWGKYPANWKINASQLKASENLFKERGLENIRHALVFWKENKDHAYCPSAASPYQLDSNWSSLFAFKTKNNL